MAPARPLHSRTPNYPADSVARSAADRDLNAPLVGASQRDTSSRRSSRVLQARARVGRTCRAYGPFLGPRRPLCSDVNNVNGPEVKLICHAGASIEKLRALRSPLVLFLFRIVPAPSFLAGLLPRGLSARSRRAKGTDPRGSKHRVDGINPAA